MQAHELMKSSRIEGFSTNFLQNFMWRTPRPPPLNTNVNLITINPELTLHCSYKPAKYCRIYR